MVNSAVPATWMAMGLRSEPSPMLVDMSASMWIKRLGCHVDLYTVSRCHPRGESEDQTSEKAYKLSTLALKPRADITRSLVAPQKKTFVLQIFFKNVTPNFARIFI